jgi:23S rRNA pseudouridine2457 synthase
LSNPRWKVAKTYFVQVENHVSDEALNKLRTGVQLNDGPTLPAEVQRVAEPEWLWPRTPPIRVRKNIPAEWLKLTIKEGSNRQVRRMTAAVGHPTLRLIRWSVGPWSIADLTPGAWREADQETDFRPEIQIRKMMIQAMDGWPYELTNLSHLLM